MRGFITVELGMCQRPWPVSDTVLALWCRSERSAAWSPGGGQQKQSIDTAVKVLSDVPVHFPRPCGLWKNSVLSMCPGALLLACENCK